MTGASGSLIRLALRMHQEHPEITHRRAVWEERVLDALLGLCRIAGVPADDVPPPLPTYDGAWIDDLLDVNEIEVAAEQQRKLDANQHHG